jgi:hyaluronan synthase
MSSEMMSFLLALLPFGIVGGIRLTAWLIKLYLSSRWRDIKATGPLPYTTVGAALTVKGEPPATFKLVLEALLSERIDQVCVTFDAGEHENMALTEAFAREHAGEIDIRFEATTEKGKRKGLRRAIEMVDGVDITICMDSDTILGEGVKQSILETFSKPGVGGVTVKQRVYQPTHLMHFMFDIRLVSRYNLEAPGQALGGYVSCLSGRCSAYLTPVLKEIKQNLVNEEWMGIRKTGGGEDKCLTTFLQDAGYQSAVINDAVVYTRPETKFNVYVSQSLRWARNSWFSDLRAIFQRKYWMVNNPIMLFYTVDRMMSTFTLAMAVWYMSMLLLTHHFAPALFLAFWWVVSRSIKIYPYLLETRRFWVVPFYAVSSMLLSVIKIHALVTMWETGWLTRGNASKGKDFSKAIITNAYKGITASVMIMLGLIAFRTEDVWVADMPGLAELGHFYRPGETGLQVMFPVFQEYRTTLIAINDPTNLDQLNAALPDIARLGEELTLQSDMIQVIRTADLTEELANVCNLVLFGQQPTDGPISNLMSGMYDYPRQADKLAHAEPFASDAFQPIRVARAPWDKADRVILAGADRNVRYRLLGQIMGVQDAETMLQAQLGNAYFTSVSSPAGQPMTTLERLDSIEHTIPGPAVETLRARYQLVLTGDVDASTLILFLNGANITALQPGTPITVTLNDTVIDTVAVDPAASMPSIISLAAAEGLALANPLNPVVLGLEFPASGLVDPQVAASDLWQQLDTFSGVQWQAQPAAPVSLASYPFPYLSMQDVLPTTFIIPDAPAPTDLNHLVRLVAFLGANGHPADQIFVTSPSQLDGAQIANSNVIVIGPVDRQSISASLEQTALATTDVDIRSVLPTLDAGFLWTGASPWNPERHIIVASGATEEGAIRAAVALERGTVLIEAMAMGAIVRNDDTLVPFIGYDQVALTNVPAALTVNTPSVQGASS